MENFDRNIDDLLNLTDTESSSSSTHEVFDSLQPYVLELNGIKKDELATDKVTPEAKIKKKRKRATAGVDIKSGSTTSSSDSIPTLAEAAGKEEFYDANGSYHGLTDGQAKPAAAVALAQAHSEHSQDAKLIPELTAQPQRTSASPRDPANTIAKPAVPSK